MVTTVEAAIELVDIVKCAYQAPAGTVTLAGTAATAGSLLESPTTAPLACAGALRCTVPVKAVPPATLLEERLTSTRGLGAST